MNQNLVSIEFSPATLVKLDEAIGVIEEVFAPFVQLSAEQVRKLNKMKPTSDDELANHPTTENGPEDVALNAIAF